MSGKKMTGMKCLVKIVEDLSVATPKVLGGQRNGTLNRSAEAIDGTSKDTEGNWTETLQGFKTWGVECDGALIENDEAYALLEDKFMDSEPVGVVVTFSSGTTYKGLVSITDFPINLPYNDLVTYNVSLQGNGPLTKTTTGAGEQL
ncbi:phage major tail protein, TP901-1 family [Cytobacillus horneckiae]|uniref:phage major tail protein, TP901-1 family n=1 Tax=Cytobacillus horneckiae TaxID=549687 RepID=UPI0034CE619D